MFDQIWWQIPERQNRASSSWWFFILFPKGNEGYGPKQLMFSIASRVGEHICFNGDWMPGMDLHRSIEDGIDEFNAVSFGWYGDEEQVQEDIVKQHANATLSREEQRLTAWSEQDDGTRRGSEITSSTDHSLGLDAHFIGDDGEARFEVWGDRESPMTAPRADTFIGGTQNLAWPRMRFKGDFDLPGGRQTLEGLGYFQRVRLNLPLFPWKWFCMFFPDGTALTVFVPYLGPQLFRNGHRFFQSGKLERATISLRQAGQWEWGDSGKQTLFDTARVEPVLDSGSHPRFAVHVRNKQDDFVKFVATPYNHVRNYIDHPFLHGLAKSHYTHNEYLFRTEKLEGRVGGRKVTEKMMGRGFGNLEYTWGLGL